MPCTRHYLKMADSEFPWVGELHHGHQAAGEQPLNDTHLSTLCRGTMPAKERMKQELSSSIPSAFEAKCQTVWERDYNTFVSILHSLVLHSNTSGWTPGCKSALVSYLSRSLAPACLVHSVETVGSHSWFPLLGI